jgi:hypothetical protein
LANTFAYFTSNYGTLSYTYQPPPPPALYSKEWKRQENQKQLQEWQEEFDRLSKDLPPFVDFEEQ